ncbi:hypothetical protein GLOTRDRAFT_112408 [Gloeophyllum trabeum ATCC 11539]|uniref:Uncharacterized protein n=1 Tax=Gloeophyllum trabeum (strain ATCC 11539 / FP-39264 / Madison 617) TaxID=670483 RepID=S7RGB5_GLOTA|nr:uncharacterized protein GLOTRDRAFT_112408 [Gloeophyllum trabeum ATCC 11539]EPQ51569.1 hypothetical protein GLOTRDRAFT_112408 [Gloeophyllum trabeum ATCC 11539]
MVHDKGRWMMRRRPTRPSGQRVDTSRASNTAAKDMLAPWTVCGYEREMIQIKRQHPSCRVLWDHDASYAHVGRAAHFK